jgi:hypothetical protein
MSGHLETPILTVTTTSDMTWVPAEIGRALTCQSLPASELPGENQQEGLIGDGVPLHATV